VLAARHDFSGRRPEIFPAISTRYLEIHESDQGSADVTKGTRAGIGVNWERCRYDWSQPNSVKATVTDSNVYRPDSSWELRATPTAHGSQVEMIWVRNFKRDARGKVFGTLFRLIGRPIFTHEAKRIHESRPRKPAVSLRGQEGRLLGQGTWSCGPTTSMS
jgi:hypothetical protein